MLDKGEAQLAKKPRFYSKNWYDLERGRVAKGDEDRLANILREKYGDRAWYVSRDNDPNDPCPICGRSDGPCSCLVFEGG